jgi:hypothetical protein
VGHCPSTGKPFILSVHNLDAGCHRSPWSNAYVPDHPEGPTPPADLREWEVEANGLFAAYTDAYYASGTSSVYFWGTEKGPACAVYITADDDESEASWYSTHVVEILESGGPSALYRLTSTVRLRFNMKSGKTEGGLSGQLSKRWDKDLSVAGGHVGNIGDLVREAERTLAAALHGIHLPNVAQAVRQLHDPNGPPVTPPPGDEAADLRAQWLARAQQPRGQSPGADITVLPAS